MNAITSLAQQQWEQRVAGTLPSSLPALSSSTMFGISHGNVLPPPMRPHKQVTFSSELVAALTDLEEPDGYFLVDSGAVDNVVDLRSFPEQPMDQGRAAPLYGVTGNSLEVQGRQGPEAQSPK